MIEVQDLVYEYPEHRALDGIDLRIEAGTITALVGPNGAGKTTLLRCLAALEMPYAGRVLIDGLDTAQHPRRVHERLGFLADFFGLYDQLSVARCLTYAALSHGVSGRAAHAAAEKAAARVGLSDRMGQRAIELSRGLRQRLAIGQAIVHEPRALLLDEPAAGLDPDARRSLSALFLELRAGGMTLLVSSHILSELEDYSSSMLVIRDGKLAGGRAVTLHPETSVYRIELETSVAGFTEFVQKQPGVLKAAADGASVLATLDGPGRRANLLRAIIGAGYQLVAFSEVKQSLEAAYRAQGGGGAP